MDLTQNKLFEEAKSSLLKMLQSTHQGEISKANILALIYQNSPCFREDEEFRKVRSFLGEYKFKDIVTPGGVPALIPIELFNAVQQRIAKTKKAPSSHKAIDDYLLTTKLYCGHCGSFMVGESGTSNSNRIYRYYKCVTAKRRKGCHKKAVRKEWIEENVEFSLEDEYKI